MKIGLVLAGGGSRGAYQIGVWKALIELGIDKHIQVVSGTSIGAMNAMLFQQGNYKMAEEFWTNVTKEQIMPMDEKELGLKAVLFALGAKNMAFVKKYLPKAVKAGTLSREGLSTFIDKLDFNAIKNSSVKGYATCTRIPELKAEYFYVNENTVENIRKILFATSAVPMVYDSEGIDDIHYLDGAIVDNVPVQPVYGESCDIIIVVQLSNDNLVDKSMFPNTRIIEIIPDDVEGPDLKGMMDFDVNMIRKRISKGYKDTLYMFKPIMDITRVVDNAEKKLDNKKVNKLLGLFKKA